VNSKRHSLDLIVVVALFCLYTGSALVLCAIGVQVYRGTADTMRQDYNSRTSILYVTEKIRHYDTDGGIRVDKVGGTDALVLIEKRSDYTLETWLFVQDGVLYEGLFIAGTPPDIKLCQRILPMGSMEIRALDKGGLTREISSQTGGMKGVQLISISFITVDDHVSSIDLWLRAAERSGT